MTTPDQPSHASFPLGQIMATPGCLRALEEAGEQASDFLQRHQRRDWGCVCAEDRRANDDALIEGARLLSAYRLRNGVRIWIITEGDRSVTTLLLPNEY